MPDNQQARAEALRYRSGAVARLTGIPVQTLRVWERRYKIVGPRKSTTGQRLYSPEEVARLTLIKQLVVAGHAIGSIAALDMDLLQAMRDKAARAAMDLPRATAANATEKLPPVRVAIVGDALAMRVEHYRLPALHVVATSPNAARAGEALQGVMADALLIELPTLQRETPRLVRSLAQQVGARHVVVEYGYGPQRFEQELRSLGFLLAHAPLNIEQLESLCDVLPAPPRAAPPASLPPIDPAPPRRFDNRMLAEISMASVALNCECPRHITDLLVRLNNFETYSAECESRSPADAALHHYLKEVTGSARALLEEALAHVVAAEGISMPA
ncbi:MAG: MerR family transcriptional regulator [Sulfuritalea sp.]|nr:MerR family transcriptional regulator [Sulfuritalea sp.]